MAQVKNDLDLYDRVAEQWWTDETPWLRTLKNMAPARFRYFDRFVTDWRGLRVLDLGCGGGFMSEVLAARGAQVSAIDPAAKAIAAARAHAASAGYEIDYRVGVGEALPFDAGAFDAVICVDVLEHVTDLDQVLDEVRRVLRPGGWFLFDTINRTWLARRVVIDAAERVLGLLPRGTHDPDLFIAPKTLAAKLGARGYRQEKLAGLGPVGVNRRLDFVFGVTPVTWILYLGAAQTPDAADAPPPVAS